MLIVTVILVEWLYAAGYGLRWLDQMILKNVKTLFNVIGIVLVCLLIDNLGSELVMYLVANNCLVQFYKMIQQMIA